MVPGGFLGQRRSYGEGKAPECDLLRRRLMPRFQELIILIEDRYRLIRKIGEGGFGLVYLGTHLSTYSSTIG